MDRSQEPPPPDLIAAMQALAEEVLARCDRVLVPLAGLPAAGQGLCWECRGPAEVRVSMRLDGAEMFWGLACRRHQDDQVHVAVSG